MISSVDPQEVLAAARQETPLWRLYGYSHRFSYMVWGANTRQELKRRVEAQGIRYYGSMTRDNLQRVREKIKREKLDKSKKA